MDRKSIENLPRIHPILYHGYLYFVSTFPLNTTILPILLCKLNFFDALSVPHFVQYHITFCANENFEKMSSNVLHYLRHLVYGLLSSTSYKLLIKVHEFKNSKMLSSSYFTALLFLLLSISKTKYYYYYYYY